MGGGLLEGGELFERGGGLNRGFRVIHKFFFLIGDTDGSLRSHLWFCGKVMSEKRVHKFYTDDASLPRSG